MRGAHDANEHWHSLERMMQKVSKRERLEQNEARIAQTARSLYIWSMGRSRSMETWYELTFTSSTVWQSIASSFVLESLQSQQCIHGIHGKAASPWLPCNGRNGGLASAVAGCEHVVAPTHPGWWVIRRPPRSGPSGMAGIIRARAQGELSHCLPRCASVPIFSRSEAEGPSATPARSASVSTPLRSPVCSAHTPTARMVPSIQSRTQCMSFSTPY